MASDIASSLTRLAEKSRFLTERYKVVIQERDLAIQRIAQLEKDVRDRDHQLQLMRAELEYLKVSSVLAPNAEAVTNTRIMLRDIISEIDRCLAELKE